MDEYVGQDEGETRKKWVSRIIIPRNGSKSMWTPDAWSMLGISWIRNFLQIK